MAPVETVLKTFDCRQDRRSKQTSIFSCFDRRFYWRSKFLTAVPTGGQRFWPPFLPAIKGFDLPFYQPINVLNAVSTSALGFGAPCLPLAPKCLPIVQEPPKTEILCKKDSRWIQIQKNVQRHGLIPLPIFWYVVLPPSFSSDTTFKLSLIESVWCMPRSSF